MITLRQAQKLARKLDAAKVQYKDIKSYRRMTLGQMAGVSAGFLNPATYGNQIAACVIAATDSHKSKRGMIGDYFVASIKSKALHWYHTPHEHKVSNDVVLNIRQIRLKQPVAYTITYLNVSDITLNGVKVYEISHDEMKAECVRYKACPTHGTYKDEVSLTLSAQDLVSWEKYRNRKLERLFYDSVMVGSVLKNSKTRFSGWPKGWWKKSNYVGIDGIQYHRGTPVF